MADDDKMTFDLSSLVASCKAKSLDRMLQVAVVRSNGCTMYDGVVTAYNIGNPAHKPANSCNSFLNGYKVSRSQITSLAKPFDGQVIVRVPPPKLIGEILNLAPPISVIVFGGALFVRPRSS